MSQGTKQIRSGRISRAAILIEYLARECKNTYNKSDYMEGYAEGQRKAFEQAARIVRDIIGEVEE